MTVSTTDSIPGDLMAMAAGAPGSAMTFALIGVTVALIVVAALMVLRLRADRAREAAARRDRAGLAAAYAQLAIAKSAAEARAAQLEATFSGMSDGVMMLDENLHLLQWNDRFAELTGVPRELLKVGTSMTDMVRAQARLGEFGRVDIDTEVASRVRAFFGRTQPAVVERTRPNGRVLELRRNPLPSGGWVTLYTDITARRRAEAAQREADRAAAELVEQKAQFVAMVSHEVAIPLETVLENLRTLARHESGEAAAGQPAPAPPGHPALARAIEAATFMATLMRDILDLAQIDAGRLPLQRRDFALAPLLDGLLTDFAARAAARDIVLVAECAAELPDRLHGDAGRLRQVLANFLANAVKFADPGTVTVRASRLDIGRPMLRLAVADPGPRIPPDQAAGLFQPFVRLGVRSGAPAPGVGLGLAICARLAALMGGQAGLAPAPGSFSQGGGNEFWVTVPLEPAQTEAPAAAPAEPATEPPAREPPRRAPATPAPAARADPAPPPPGTIDAAAAGRRRAYVLLVEDMVVNQVVTATQLRREGHRVDVASSGAEALRLAAHRPYDIVFMDLMMPGMSGYEATAELRALPPPAGQVPVFALTATTSATDRARCLEAGMQGMLSKPVRQADLVAALACRPVAPRPPPAPPAADLLLDAAHLADMQNGLPAGVFAELAEQCVADMRETLMDLHEALETGSAPAIEAAAHALAGMAGNYGMVAIGRRMRRAMASARAGDLPACRATAEGMDRELERTDAAMRLLLGARSA